MWKWMVKKLAWESFRELVWSLVRAWVLPAILGSGPIKGIPKAGLA